MGRPRHTAERSQVASQGGRGRAPGKYKGRGIPQSKQQQEGMGTYMGNGKVVRRNGREVGIRHMEEARNQPEGRTGKAHHNLPGWQGLKVDKLNQVQGKKGIESNGNKEGWNEKAQGRAIIQHPGKRCRSGRRQHNSIQELY